MAAACPEWLWLVVAGSLAAFLFGECGGLLLGGHPRMLLTFCLP
jgi:hypothetical protein